MQKKGIAIAGSLVVDNYFLIDTYPSPGELTNIRGTKMDIGGTGNLIVDLAKLDPTLPVKVSAIIGKDTYGEFIRNTLGQYKGIEMKNVTEEGNTSVTMVMNAVDTQQRTFFYMPAASDLYEECYIDWEKIHATIFHLEYLLLMKKVDAEDAVYGTHGAKILHEARARGMKTSIDIVTDVSEKGRKIVQAALCYTDYCTVNEAEAEIITGIPVMKDGVLVESAVVAALEEMNRLGVTTWAVIHSPTCNYGMDCSTKQVYKVKSLQLPKDYIKGSTGAGDAFCCGVLYGAYKEKSLAEAMQLGCACAACSLSEVSGTSGMRRYEEVMAIDKKYRVD